MARSPTELIDEYLRRELGLDAEADAAAILSALRTRFPDEGEAAPVVPPAVPAPSSLFDDAGMVLARLRRMLPGAVVDRFRDLVPRVGQRVLVATGAALVGDVTLGDDASVWYAAVLRGDIAPVSVGPRSNVQDGAVIHVATGKACAIGAEVVVGHRAVLQACRVEEGCLIGMSCTVLDDAVIGHGSIVGAGAVVTERTVVPPHSLVLGVPAKVVRSLDPAVEEKNRALALKYVALKDEYLRRPGAAG